MMMRCRRGMEGVDRLVTAGLFAVASKGETVVLTSDPLARRLTEIKKIRRAAPKFRKKSVPDNWHLFIAFFSAKGWRLDCIANRRQQHVFVDRLLQKLNSTRLQRLALLIGRRAGAEENNRNWL
jgi:hypothetical protein